MLGLLVSEAGENSRNLFQFAPFHQAIRGPTQDYTKFGEEFFDILIVDGRSACVRAVVGWGGGGAACVAMT
jgi:hypothetical protein